MLARKDKTAILLHTSSCYSVTNDGGLTWRSYDPPLNTTPGTVAYNPESDVFIFLVTNTSSNVCYTSKDCVTWLPRNMASSQSWKSLGVYAGLFIAMSYQTTVWNYSRDGVSWSPMVAPLQGMQNMYDYWTGNENLFLTTSNGGGTSFCAAILKDYDPEVQFQLPAYTQTPGAPGWFVKVK
jgi:hypothetical protein